jgi:hypothetical protein
MTRQAYRQLQRSRPDLKLPHITAMTREHRKLVATMTRAEFMAWRAIRLLNGADEVENREKVFNAKHFAGTWQFNSP